MSKKKREETPDEQATQLDHCDELVPGTLERLVLPPPCKDTSVEAATNSLTESDHEALAGLGSSSELVRKIIDQRHLQTRPLKPAETPTYSTGEGETEATPVGVVEEREPENSFAKLVTDQANFDRTEVVHWTSYFRKKRVLGRGGQGVVYLTEFLDELGGEQALKTFSAAPYGDVKSYLEEMQRMGRVASAVKRIHHDNLLDVERFIHLSGFYIMIMQLIDGFDLHRLLEPELIEKLRNSVDKRRWDFLSDVVYTRNESGHWCLQPGVAVNIIEKCLRGLSSLHGKGIVHADVKPTNIMLDCYGGIKLIDIGSAFELDAKPAKQTWTPLYAPPEFFESRQWTSQSDMACLGYVLIELLTGQTAVTVAGVSRHSTRSDNSNRNDALLQAKLDLPRRLNEFLPETVLRSEHLMSLVRRLIDPDPQNRFSDAADAIEGPHGTHQFRKQLMRGDLDVYDANEIQRWIEDVKKVER